MKPLPTLLSTGIAIAVVLSIVPFVSSEIRKPDADTLFESVSSSESQTFDGKYQRVEKQTSPEGVTYEVHEYVSPKGPGYQTFIYEKGNFTESRGYGPEAESRTYKAPARATFTRTTST